MKKIFFILIFAIGILSMPHFGFADSVQNVESANGYRSFGNSCSGHNYFQATTAGTYIGASEDMIGSFNTPSSPYTALITDTSGTVLASSSVPIQPAGTDTITWMFSSPVTFASGTSYAFYYTAGHGDTLHGGLAGCAGAPFTLLSPVPLVPTIHFSYPTSTSFLYNPFPYVSTNITGLSSTTVYRDTMTVCIQGSSNCTNNGSEVFSGAHQDVNGNLAQTWSNPAEYNNFGNATSVGLEFHVILYDNNGNLQDQTSTIIQMIPAHAGTLNPYGTSTIINCYDTPYAATSSWDGTITCNAPYFSNPTPFYQTESSTTFCEKPSSITDIGGGIAYGLCSGGNILFTPNSNVTIYWSNGLTSLQGAFPFSVVFGIHNIIIGVANSTEASGTSQEYVAQLNLGSTTPAFAGHNTPIVFLSSSTLINLVGQQGKDLIFTLEDAILWILAAFAIYKSTSGNHKK